MIPERLSSGFVSINDQVYYTKNGSNGHIELYSASMSAEFKMVKTVMQSPLNRFNHCCVPFSQKQFLMLGGDGHGIKSFEIWRFDSESLTWTQITEANGQKITRRSGHCATSVLQDGKFKIFVFGGVNGLLMAKTVLVITISGNTFTFKEISPGEKWPCPRIHATLTLNQTIIRMFGGENENGDCLGELWEFDSVFFEVCPNWREVSDDGPHERKLHQSWSDGCETYIAGGKGKSGRLYDIWKYGQGGWEQVMIFETKNDIFACQLGLCEVGETLELVKQRSPFASLDSLFAEIKALQRDFSEKSEGENCKFKQQYEILREHNDALKSWSRNEDPPPGVEEAMNQVSSLRKALCDDVKEIVQEFQYCVKQKPAMNHERKEIAVQMNIMLQEIRDKMDTLNREREIEVLLSEQQIKNLESCTANAPEADIDPANFQSFTKFLETLGPKSQQTHAALNDYYGMQLRQYQHLTTKIGLMKARKEERELTIPIYERSTSRISGKLAKCIARVKKYEKELAAWTRYEEEARKQADDGAEYISMITQYQNDPSIAPEIEKQLDSEQNEIREQIKEGLLDLVQKNRDTMESIWQKLMDLQKEIQDMTWMQAQAAGMEKAVEIEQLISKLSHK